jgi:DNA-binding transcriptional ArsR family regulator
LSPDLDATFSALADPTRRGVVELLRKQPRRASDLADALDASRPAMSRHLRVLRASGLIETTDDDTDDADARERIYKLRKAPFDQLRDWLEQTERFWSVQLDSFKAHVERTRGKR